MEEPFYVYGNHVGTRTRYNDRLLMFMLRNRAPERFGNSVTKGGGDLKGLNAVGKMEQRRLKQQWRAEWEAEQRNVSPQEVRASIDRKVAAIRQEIEQRRAREWAQLSPETRAAWEQFETLRNRDLDALRADEAMRRRLEQGPRQDEQWSTPPPPKELPAPKPPKTVHKLTDDGWEADRWV